MDILALVDRIEHRPGKMLVIPDALSRVHHVAYQVNETKTQIQKLLEKFGIKPQDGKMLDDQLKFRMLKLCSPAQTSQKSSENMGQLAPSTKGHHFGPEVLHGSTCSPVCAPRAHITQGFSIGQNTEYTIDGSTLCETFVNASGVRALQFSGKGKRFVVGLKPSLLGPTILVNLQAV